MNANVTDSSQFGTFYVDDSTCQIDRKTHFILAATTFGNLEDKAVKDWLQKKSSCGVPPYEEIRWNTRNLPLAQRQEFVPLASSGTGLIAIDDRSKQHAALNLATLATKMNCRGFGSDLTETSLGLATTAVSRECAFSSMRGFLPSGFEGRTTLAGGGFPRWRGQAID